ncbi:MAG: hypothetical protein M1281_02640 [Chloroflexi bacterium]|nr:hypothetical protein [Chloroflexota bacterium]
MPDTPGKTQQMIFTNEVLPSLFHTSPKEFLRFLNRDGNKFLRFYWDQAGKQLEVPLEAAPLGLTYDLRQPEEHTTVALIVLPKPRREGEAYFAALIFRPLRRTPFLGISDTTKVIILEQGSQPGSVLLREWTRKMAPEVLPESAEPKLDAFYRAVCEIIGISAPE